MEKASRSADHALTGLNERRGQLVNETAV
jgi:hypothetical protein